MEARLFLLDTHIVIYARKGMETVLRRLREAGREQVAIPTLVAAELAYGVEKSERPAHNREVLEHLLREFTLLPWTQQAIWHYASHYHRLRSQGQLIGHMDLLIASQALALEATLVTNNLREFERIDGLQLENWAA